MLSYLFGQHKPSPPPLAVEIVNMRIPYWEMILAQIVVGCNVVLAKYLIESMPALLYIEIRFLCSALLLAIICTLLKEKTYAPGLSWDTRSPKARLEDVGLLIALACLGGVSFNVLMTMGLDYSSAANVGVVSATLSAMTVFLSWLLLKEKIHSALIGSVMLAIVGVLFLNYEQTITPENNHPFWGNFLAFLAMVPEAFYTILNRISGKRFTALGTAFWASFLTFVIVLPFLFWAEDRHSILRALAHLQQEPRLIALLGLSALSAIVFYWGWSRGLEKATASLGALFGGVMPITSVLLGVFYLGEPFGLWQWAGLLLVLLSILWGAKSSAHS